MTKLRNWIVFGALNLLIIGVFIIGMTNFVSNELYEYLVGYVIGAICFLYGVAAIATIFVLRVKWTKAFWILNIIGLVLSLVPFVLWAIWMAVGGDGNSYLMYVLILNLVVIIVFGVLVVMSRRMIKALRGDVWGKMGQGKY